MSETQKLLAGQIALVTGGSQGLGRAMAKALAEAGAYVTITARSQENLQETALLLQEAGHTVLALEGDVTDQASVEEIVQRTDMLSSQHNLAMRAVEDKRATDEKQFVAGGRGPRGERFFIWSTPL